MELDGEAVSRFFVGFHHAASGSAVYYFYICPLERFILWMHVGCEWLGTVAIVWRCLPRVLQQRYGSSSGTCLQSCLCSYGNQ